MSCPAAIGAAGTFAFNGGLRRSSSYLNSAAIGPKRIQFVGQAMSLGTRRSSRRNPGSWARFQRSRVHLRSATAFSRSRIDEGETKKQFYATEPESNISPSRLDWSGEE